MNRERNISLTIISILVDILIVGVSFVIAYYEKINLPGDLASLGRIQEYGWIFLLYLALVIGAMYLSGFYTFGRTLNFTDIVLGVVKSAGAAFALLIFILFTFKIETISRLFLGLFCLNNALLLIFAKGGFRLVTTKMQEHGYNVINALVVGSGKRARQVIDNLANHPDLGYRVVGCLDSDPEMVGSFVEGVEVIGTVDNLDAILDEYSIDEVFVAMPFDQIEGMNKLIYLCEEIGVRLSLVADWVKPHIAKTVIRSLSDLPVITYTATPTAVGQLLLKAVFDRVAAFILLIVLSPVFLAIAIAIKVSSKGPVMYQQERAGLNGRPFDMLKFRTMIPGADQIKDQYNDLNEMDGPVFKIKNDPRVTGIGRFLRKTSLDELPQLINVFRGEMSLVGPRPPVPEEVAKYERWQRRRLSMKPGITCFWQISGRNEVKFEDWMEMDLKYIDNWSIKLDVIILLKTIPVVLTGRGAS